MAGVQGGTCACDTVLAASAKMETLSACNVPYVGNSREFCGASGRWNVYVKNATSVDGNGMPVSMNQPNQATVMANSTAAT